MNLDLRKDTMDNSKLYNLVELIKAIIGGTQTTECILLSIIFFLLDLEHLKVSDEELLAQVRKDLLLKCSLPETLTWV